MLCGGFSVEIPVPFSGDPSHFEIDSSWRVVALPLEKSINQSLLDLHKCSEVNGDAEVTSLPPPPSPIPWR